MWKTNQKKEDLDKMMYFPRMYTFFFPLTLPHVHDGLSFSFFLFLGCLILKKSVSYSIPPITALFLFLWC